MNKKRKRIIRFIDYNIFDIEIEDRIIVLNMIALILGNKELYEEGSGIRILYKHMNNVLLESIYEFIIESKKKTQLIL